MALTGFFDLPEEPRARKAKGATGCLACGLNKKCKSPKMPTAGEGQLGVLFMGEAPGETEDNLNKGFVGQSGGIIRKHVITNGYNFDRDFYRLNAVSCRPTTSKGSNRTPTNKEIKYCEPIWRREIEVLKPSFIFLFGAKAVEAFLMYRSHPITRDLSIARWRKICFPDVQTGAWIIPLYHPSYVIRNPHLEPIFKLDFVWALNQLNRTKPEFEDFKKKVKTITNYEELIYLLKSILERKPVLSFDYETSGIRPWHKGHHIWTIGVSEVGSDEGFAFPYSYPNVWDSVQFALIKHLWGEILGNPEIEKAAQSIQMERPWSKYIIGVDPDGWTWDTMVCSHVIDNRQGYTGLDFQVFINWGYEYGDDIEPYKKNVKESVFNRMHEAPLIPLLKYNALDAYFTTKLMEKQWELLSEPNPVSNNILRAYSNLFHDGILCFSDMEEEGIRVDVDYYKKVQTRLGKMQAFITKKLMSSPEANLFEKHIGKKIDLGSTEDLNKLVYNILKIPVGKTTDKGNPSMDVDVLESIELPFAKDLIRLRKINKNKTTYVDGMIELQVDNRIHPNFNLHLVRTYRSSSDKPNFHNLPRRDKASMEMIRGGIIPSPGNCIIEADYGAMEVRIVTCYSKDPALVKPCRELRDKFDPHQEWATVLDVSRFDSKNGFVFAEIYGSYFENIYKDLQARGYINLLKSTVQQAEKEFWKKYKVTREFQEQMVKFYFANGYVPMKHGFMRSGYLKRNEIVNTFVQGTAFHCLLWACIRVNQIRKREEWKSKLIGQIHDSILMDTYPPEVDHVVATLRRVMTEDILKDHPWIIVPLLSEIEVTEIDKPWYTKTEYEKD